GDRADRGVWLPRMETRRHETSAPPPSMAEIRYRGKAIGQSQPPPPLGVAGCAVRQKKCPARRGGAGWDHRVFSYQRDFRYSTRSLTWPGERLSCSGVW